MKQQTAVEWMINKIGQNLEMPIEEGKMMFEQAKEMEKQQIIDVFGIGCHHESKRLVGYQDIAEQYYNETYGSKGSDAQRIYGEHTIQILEISDEEIANEAKVWNLEDLISSQKSFICGAKWYREQIRKTSANK